MKSDRSPEEQRLLDVLLVRLNTIQEYVEMHHRLADNFPGAPIMTNPVVSVKEIQDCRIAVDGDPRDGEEVKFTALLLVSVQVLQGDGSVVDHDCDAVLQGKATKAPRGYVDVKWQFDAVIEPPKNTRRTKY